MTKRILDRVPEPSRNADYPARTLLAQRTISRTQVHWNSGPVLDQGEEGACVCFAWTHELQSTPVAVNLPAVRLPKSFPHDPTRFAHRVYWAAQRHDEWDGGSYPGATEHYEGTSVLAGVKQMVRLGFIGGYRWAFNPLEVRDVLLGLGPVVIGVNWREGMWDAPDGVCRVQGSVVGGHCVLLNGFEPARDLGDGPTAAFRIRNSWGTNWGDGDTGEAWVSEAGLALLLDDQGDACVATSRSYGKPIV